MEHLSTTASFYSRRSSFNENLKPKPKHKYNNVFKGNGYYSPRKRLKINNHILDELTEKTTQAFKRSYLFNPGKQKQDKHFEKTFCGVYGAYRGGENLVDKVSYDLAKALPNYDDISETIYYTDDTLDTNVEVTKHLPTKALIAELQDILESKYGLQEELLEAFQSNGKKLNEELNLQDRDTWITEFRNAGESITTDFIFDIPLSILATAFPRTVEVLQEIMENLLKSEWLKEDIAGVKFYLGENPQIDRPLGDIAQLEQAITLWEQAKWQGDQQKLKDKKHWENVKDDMLGVVISGGLSYATANPSFIIGKLSQFTVNRIADKSDPHGQDKGIQALKAIAGAGLGGVMGGNLWDLGTALGVDLLDISTENPNEERGAIRGLGISTLKGVLTEDKKKLVTHFLCGATAEVVRKLPENDENTPLDVRIARAFLNNADIHSYYIGKWVDTKFKEPPKPKTDGVLTPEEQAKYPKQQLKTDDPTPQEINQKIDTLIQKVHQQDDVIKTGTEHLNNLYQSGEYQDNAHYEVKKKSGDWRVYRDGMEVHHEYSDSKGAKKRCQEAIPTLTKKYGTFVETPASIEAQNALNIAYSDKTSYLQEIGSLKQQLPYDTITPSTAPSQPMNFSLSMESNKSQEHFVYRHDSQGNKRQIGKFSSKAAAQDFFNTTNDYFSGINKQNQERAEAKNHYYSQGLNPDDISRLNPIEPLYVEISACGSKTNVYQGDQKVFKGKGNSGRNDGLTKTKELMHEHLSSNDQQIHHVKTKMAEEIFTSSTIPDPIKEAEFNRITHDQNQHVQELDQTHQKHQSLGRDIPKAEKQAEKERKDADDAWWIDYKKERRYQNSRNAFKQKKTDQEFTGDTTGKIQKKIEDNNFLLQIA